jgi:uncharacterized membrane protein YdjX (TVP38/TMEM64 family)
VLRWIAPVLLLGGLLAFFAFDLQRYFSLEALRSSRDTLIALRDLHPVAMSLGFMLAFCAVAVFMLPVAAALTVLSGAVFGLGWGSLIVSFGASLGAAVGFLLSRYVLRELVRQRFAAQLRSIDQGLQRDGLFYLASMRLVPVLPFSIINLVMGITAMRLLPFYAVTQLASLPSTLLYSNAGAQLMHLQSLHDILSPALLASFLALALMPLALSALLRRRTAK